MVRQDKLTFGKNIHRRSIRQKPRPALELPGRTLDKDSHDTIPVNNQNSFKCTFKLYLKHYSHFSITIIYAWQIIWLVLVLTISTACRPSLPQPMKVHVCDLIRLPVLWGQFKWLVDHSVRNGDANCGSAWLHLIFPSLQKNLIVSLNALFLFIFWRDKPANQQLN